MKKNLTTLAISINLIKFIGNDGNSKTWKNKNKFLKKSKQNYLL